MIKMYCGFDGISTKLVKATKDEIIKSITLIINQRINTGIYPNQL